jgi:hypothetical protein
LSNTKVLEIMYIQLSTGKITCTKMCRLVNLICQPKIACIFFGIANYPFLGNLGNLNHSKYSKSETQAKFTITIVDSLYMEEYLTKL